MDEVSQLSEEQIREEQENQAKSLGLSYEEFLLEYRSGKLGRFGETPSVDQSRELLPDMSPGASRDRFLKRSSGL